MLCLIRVVYAARRPRYFFLRLRWRCIVLCRHMPIVVYATLERCLRYVVAACCYGMLPRTYDKERRVALLFMLILYAITLFADEVMLLLMFSPFYFC